ncbi:DUF4249 domain-containing protein [Bacteroidales bacterium OttesenSCG-928-A17]|nr:DUF4249 domain-containing protein [Bacteroidales bacterium OttesenSCG-928-A17]
MRKRLLIGLYSLLIVSLIGCDEETAIAYVDYEPKIVIEGYIENEAPARVLLTKSAAFSHALDSIYLLKHVIQSAKVSVSNGQESEILTLGVDQNYFPPYVYSGEKIKGEPGKTYHLRIEYDEKVITATTVIPESIVQINDCWATEQDAQNGSLNVNFYNTGDTDLYYQTATRIVQTEKSFTICLYGNFPSGNFLSGELVPMTLNRGLNVNHSSDYFSEFCRGDVVEIRLRTMYQDSYDFWVSWENEILNAMNPIFPAHTNLNSNIKSPDAIGIWAGYGTSYYRYLVDY